MFVVVVMLITRGGKQRALELELELSGRAGLEVSHLSLGLGNVECGPRIGLG